MSNLVTLTTLIAKIRLQADKPSSVRPTDANITSLINDSVRELHDIVLNKEPSRLLSSGNVTVVADTGSYSLAADFYKCLAVLIYDTSYTNDYYRLERIPFEERYDYATVLNKEDTRYDIRNGQLFLWPVPDWSGTVKVEYIPAPTVYTTAASTMEMYNGWDSWVVYDVTIKLKAKDEEDIQAEMVLKQQQEARILASSIVDVGKPMRVVDTYRPGMRRGTNSRSPWRRY